jgi:hypothetical protein
VLLLLQILSHPLELLIFSGAALGDLVLDHAFVELVDGLTEFLILGLLVLKFFFNFVELGHFGFQFHMLTLKVQLDFQVFYLIVEILVATE